MRSDWRELPISSRSVDLVIGDGCYAALGSLAGARDLNREIHRILRPGGWTAFVWNQRRTQSTPFLDAYEKLLLQYGTDYQQVRHERTTDTIETFFAPSPYQAVAFDCAQKFDYPALEGRLLSSSYAPLPPHPKCAPMLEALRRIFNLHQVNGRVAMEYTTRLYYGQLA